MVSLTVTAHRTPDSGLAWSSLMTGCAFHQFVADTDACGQLVCHCSQGGVYRLPELVTHAFVADVRDRIVNRGNGRDVVKHTAKRTGIAGRPTQHLTVDRYAVFTIRSLDKYAVAHDGFSLKMSAW